METLLHCLLLIFRAYYERTGWVEGQYFALFVNGLPRVTTCTKSDPLAYNHPPDAGGVAAHN